MATIALRTYLEEIRSYIDEGATNQALAHLKHLVTLNPKSIAAYRLMGDAFLKNNDLASAKEMYQRVLSAEPTDAAAHAGLATVLSQRDEISDAIWHAERAFEREPSNASVRDQLSDLYTSRDGQAPERILLTRAALSRLYLNGDLYDQAIAECQIALGEQPDRTDLQLILAEAQWRSGKTEAATEGCEELLKRLPNCRPAHHILANIWQDAGVFERARPHQLALRDLDPYYKSIEDLTELDAAQYAASQAVEVERLVIHDKTTKVALSPTVEKLTGTPEIANIEEELESQPILDEIAIAPPTIEDTQPIVPSTVDSLAEIEEDSVSESSNSEPSPLSAPETEQDAFDTPTDVESDLETEVDNMTGNDSIFQPSDDNEGDNPSSWFDSNSNDLPDTGGLASIFGQISESENEPDHSLGDILEPDEAMLQNIFNLTEDGTATDADNSADDLPDWLKAISESADEPTPEPVKIDPLEELIQPPSASTEPVMPEISPDPESVAEEVMAELDAIIAPSEVIETEQADMVAEPTTVEALIGEPVQVDAEPKIEKGELPEWLAPFGVPSGKDALSMEPIIGNTTGQNASVSEETVKIEETNPGTSFEVPEMPDWLPEPVETVRQTAADSTMPTVKASTKVEDTSPDWLRKPEEDPFSELGGGDLDVPDWLHQAMQADGATSSQPPVDMVIEPDSTPEPAGEPVAINPFDDLDSVAEKLEAQVGSGIDSISETVDDIETGVEDAIPELPPIEVIAEDTIKPVTDELPMEVEEIIEPLIAPEIEVPTFEAELPSMGAAADTTVEPLQMPELGANLDISDDLPELDPELPDPILPSVEDALEEVSLPEPEVDLAGISELTPVADDSDPVELPNIDSLLEGAVTENLDVSATVDADVTLPELDIEEELDLPTLSELAPLAGDTTETAELGLEKLEAFIDEEVPTPSRVTAELAPDNPSWLQDILGEPTVETNQTLTEDDINTIFAEASQQEDVTTAEVEVTSSTDDLVEETAAWLDSIREDNDNTPSAAEVKVEAIAAEAPDVEPAAELPQWLKNLSADGNDAAPADSSIGDVSETELSPLDMGTPVVEKVEETPTEETSGWQRVEAPPESSEPDDVSALVETAEELPEPTESEISLDPLGGLGALLIPETPTVDSISSGLSSIDDKIEAVVDEIVEPEVEVAVEPSVAEVTEVVETEIEDIVEEITPPASVETPPVATVETPKAAITPPLPTVATSLEDIDALKAARVRKPQIKVSKPSGNLGENLIEHAHGLFDSGDTDRAYDVFQKLVKSGKNLERVTAHLEVISKSKNATPLWMQLLGDAYMRNDQLQKALEAYKSALASF